MDGAQLCRFASVAILGGGHSGTPDDTNTVVVLAEEMGKDVRTATRAAASSPVERQRRHQVTRNSLTPYRPTVGGRISISSSGAAVRIPGNRSNSIE